MTETMQSPQMMARRLSPQKDLLIQIAVCTVPAMALLSASLLRVAGLYFFGVFLILLSYRLVRRDPKSLMCMTIACVPALMLFRNSLSYSSVEAILALSVLFWISAEPAEFVRLFNDRLMTCVFLFVILYWLVSFARTGDYSSNLRAFEWLLSAAGVRLLGKYRSLLGTALIGLAITTFAMGLAFARFGDRLGMAEIDGERMGNPISFGMPMALIFLLSLAEGGRWLMLQEKPAWRIITNIGAGILLLLSTSRGSWAVVVVCLFVLLVGQRGRGKLLKYLAIITLGLSLWAYFADSSVLEKYIYKTFYSSEYWSADNNARVAQWESFPKAFGDSPVWGFGPGSGKSVSLAYSGHKLIWHALYLHMAIECGTIGVGLLGYLLLALVIRGVRYARLTGELAPLLGIVSFIVVACTIPAIDAASGLFVGVGFLSAETSGLWVVRVRQDSEAEGRPIGANSLPGALPAR